ncbi:MAG: ABC transporter ATP-binding protein [Deltaproteobacteria bacterium]|nr:ABC transporter ATP-binding protein [Deltaproteobacteria bacterium]MBW1961697.1 ABC transporter ATP-binding protein [Deltaproteobacteria bacterium]MBW1993466.1 ABC transporter ATP-binding protein [Deltaproteobacteria bacterium]MBW2151015.1 ABC transporter ATP-binding protein [Deltaproteobacteria bacterium]
MKGESPVIEVKDLTKRFGNLTAVNDVSFSVYRGETLGLLGPNGAGKTTTIHLLLGLTAPTEGSITILGMDLKRYRRQILQRVNFSSTYTQLPTNLTVWENLNVFGKLYGIRKPRTKINKLLEFFGILHTLNVRTGELSSGQITRLNLAKALLNDPEIIFLDEPTASLDPEIASRVRDMLRQIQKENEITIIYTSHNMFEIEIMCNRILFMFQGKIVLKGTPEEVKKRAVVGSLEDVFIKIARDGMVKDARRMH